MTSTSDISPDVAESLARAALAEITPTSTVGAYVDRAVADDGVVTLRFETTQSAYRGWFWTVALAAIEGQDPTVLEAELLPGDDALLAPDWVPWSQRLEEYKAQQAAAEAERKVSEEESGGAGDDDDDHDDHDDHDDDDDHHDGSAYLHSGDVDGVDIDELNEHDDDHDDDSDDADDDGYDDDADGNEESGDDA